MATSGVSGRERLAFALDVADLAAARGWVARLAGEVGVFKIGLELFVAAGPDAVAVVRDAGARCFLDLKLHDIPETVARAVRAAGRYGVDLLTVHASGGEAMLTHAVDAARGAPRSPTLLAVTVLTSLDDDALAGLGFADPVAATTARLAALAIGRGIPGLVCSPREVAALRRAHPAALLVTPGVRPINSPAGDQRRTATAAAAVRDGADLLVVGRPIRDAPDPVAVARALADEIDAVAS